MATPDKSTESKAVHTVIAFVVLALFAASGFAPYFRVMPEGQGGTLILSFSEVVKNIAILVVGYYFGSTATSARRTDAITEKALSATQPPPGTVTTTTTPPAEPQSIDTVNVAADTVNVKPAAKK